MILHRGKITFDMRYENSAYNMKLLKVSKDMHVNGCDSGTSRIFKYQLLNPMMKEDR